MKDATDNFTYFGNKNMETLLDRATGKNCFINSKFSAAFLVDRYPYLFKTMLLIEARTDNTTSFKRGKWRSHSGLIFEDVLDEWHYISPANFDKKEKDNPLLTHIRAENLDLLLDKIEHLEVRNDLSLWPSAEDITTALNEKSNIDSRRVTPHMQNIIVVTRKNKKEKSSTIVNSLSSLQVVRWHND